MLSWAELESERASEAEALQRGVQRVRIGVRTGKEREDWVVLDPAHPPTQGRALRFADVRRLTFYVRYE